jgi:hypothetical protein
MANLYPASISNHPEVPESEKQVFEKLALLDDTYHVFHSLTWHDGRDGECDFIIFNELKGFISLEVKGGKIDFDGRTWRSTDSNGQAYIIKNPVEQARTSMFAIKKIYEKKYGTAIPGIYTWGVCFFDGNWKEVHRTLDLSEANVIDIKAMETPVVWIDKLFKESEERHGKKILSAKDKSSLLTLFNRSLSIPMSIRRVIDEQQRRLSVTNMNQDYLLDLFEDKNRIAFQGAAGTGKTWIAMKKAERLADSGKRVLFLCYNKTLCSFINERLNGIKNIEMVTFHSFAQSVLRDFISGEIETHNCAEHFFRLIGAVKEAGIPSESKEKKEPSDKSLQQKINGVIGMMINLPSGADYKSAVNEHGTALPKTILDVVSLLLPSSGSADDFFSERLPLAVETAFSAESSHLDHYTYDAVLIDEGQDFHKNWCDTLKFIFDKYRSRVVYIFYDDNQTIFTGQKNLPITGLISGSGLGNHVFKLRDNLRNTQEIHDFAVEMSGLGSTAKAAEIKGVPPVEENFTSGKSAAAYIGSLLEELIDDHCIEKEQVVVLSNRNIDNSIFSEENKAGDFTLVSTGEGKRVKSVRYRTIHQFKGLESDVVILLLHKRPEDKAEMERYLSDELLYVGFTRAKHLLYVVNVG